jgi:hypothetical protein
MGGQMRKIVIAAALIVSVSACMTSSQPESGGILNPSIQVQPNTQFDLSPGQEARVQGSNLTVRFSRVSDDSRCAVDVQCVWAGNAVVHLSLTSTQSAAAEASLNTTLDPKAVTYAGYSIRLVGLKPQPRSGTRITDADYVATLEAAK